jgi:hypothetical protein
MTATISFRAQSSRLHSGFINTVDHRKETRDPAYSRADDGARSLNGPRDDESDKD